MIDLFDASTLALTTSLMVILLALVAGGAAFAFLVRAERLPAATRLEDVHEKLAIAKEELSTKQDELQQIEQVIQERDRFAAEAAALREQITELRAERDNLEPARAEIEKVKQEAQMAAGELAEVESKLAEKREELERIEARLDPERLASLEQRLEELRQEAATLESRVGELRAERDAALRVLAEADQWQAKRAALELELEDLDARVAALGEEHERLEHEIAPLRMEAEEARRRIAEAERMEDRLADLEERRDALDLEIERLREEAQELEDRRADLIALQNEHLRLTEEKEALLARTETLKAMLDKLEAEIAVARGGGSSTVEREQVIDDLIREPDALKLPTVLRGVPREESDALYEVSTRLEKAGLSFPRRTLHAFHTALKVNETAQMAVLAGVSGTGKSLLPRRYAEAMGIHFLQIAVEPRWDSPQDLLGFYNYMEGRYRATELARLLAHLDPWLSIVPQEAPDRRDHMAMVLLDEMNLARIEYYFSEFLSRLEVRPPFREGLERELCADAMIPIDVRGLEDPPRLFPAHNILFVGTMNDDESTQSLSDKVLDRANVLQFPAPVEFAKGERGEITPAEEAQSFHEWRSWVRSEDSLEGGISNITEKIIRELGEIMQDFGRPFGHRLAQAIRAYVANYPVEGNAGPDPRVPLADQVEFRILPKLRGIEIDRYQEPFDRLRTLVRDGLEDGQLADRIGELCDRQRDTTGLFSWRGLARNA